MLLGIAAEPLLRLSVHRLLAVHRLLPIPHRLLPVAHLGLAVPALLAREALAVTARRGAAELGLKLAQEPAGALSLHGLGLLLLILLLVLCLFVVCLSILRLLGLRGRGAGRGGVLVRRGLVVRRAGVNMIAGGETKGGVDGRVAKTSRGWVDSLRPLRLGAAGGFGVHLTSVL